MEHTKNLKQRIVSSLLILAVIILALEPVAIVASQLHSANTANAADNYHTLRVSVNWNSQPPPP